MVVVGNHADGVSAVKAGAGSLYGGEKIVAVALIFVFDAVGNHFGVGLRFKGVAQALQAGALFFEVFDNAVVHHGNQAAGNMRVGIGLGYAAMGGPAGVADADVAVHAFFAGGIFHQLHAADTAHAGDFVAGLHGDAG